MRVPTFGLSLLGGFRLDGPDGAIALPGRKLAGLLAYLACTAPRPQPREKLAALFWGSHFEVQAKQNLRQALFRLRKVLGDDVLESDGEVVALNAAPIRCDVAQFEALVRKGGRDALSAATDLYRGALVEDINVGEEGWNEWLTGERERLLQLALGAAVALGGLELAAGNGDGALKAGQRAIALNDMREDAHRLVMRALAATGRKAEALKHYEDFVVLLRRELNANPDSATRSLVAGLRGMPQSGGSPAIRGTARQGQAQPAPPLRKPPARTTRPAMDLADGGPVLAVLAFDNLSGDPALAYFSDGVSEEIQQTVAQGSDLKVIARSSSFQFRGADKAVRKVAAELQATHLLDGSVRHSGRRVRISAQLVQCADEVILWAQRFEGDMGDIIALQDRIAEAVTQALKVSFSSPASVRAPDRRVYEIFLQARQILSEGGHIYDEAGAAALPLLEQVVEATPGYAPAWHLLAKSRALVLRSAGREGGYAEGRAGVIAAAETALRLDPRRGPAYEALAKLEPWGAYAAREALLEQALAVTPNDPGVLTEMCNFCWAVGRFREALTLAERACELNPLMPAARLRVAEMLAYVGDYDASVRMLQDLHRRWPDVHAILSSLLNFAVSLGFHDVYCQFVGGAARFSGWQATGLRQTVRYCEALISGDLQARQEILDRYTRLKDQIGFLPINYIEAVSALGLPDEAFHLAEQVSFEHMFAPDGPIPGSFPGTVLGRWSALNKTPRFIALCERLGLCAYWTQSGRWPDCVDWTPYDFKAEVRRRAGARSRNGHVAVL